MRQLADASDGRPRCRRGRLARRAAHPPPIERRMQLLARSEKRAYL